jgi:dihydrosphingosine 1-phosphate phosphatase
VYSQYKKIPQLKKDDNVIPSASEIPSLLTSLRHPRKRTVSIGPQSAADVYESIAYNEKKRRESFSSGNGSHIRQSSHSSTLDSKDDSSKMLLPSPQQTFSSQIHMYEEMMGSTAENIETLRLRTHAEKGSESPLKVSNLEDPQTSNQVTFASIERPRVRYDVEVVTKLVVYTGQPFSFSILNELSLTCTDLQESLGLLWKEI